ncbi:MAG TPA: hypothetical protein PKA58_32520 [Polyangium sp.]|nr:hypothetical protein [Polyangium sp.]
MTARLHRCPSCRVHIFEDASTCPFCAARVPVKGIVAAAAGVVALVAGIGCAYGCPDAQCSGGTGGAAGSGGEGGQTTMTGSGGAAGAGGMVVNDAGTD